MTKLGSGCSTQSSTSFIFYARAGSEKVIAPTTPHDAKGGLIASMYNNPVIFIEHRMLYNNAGYVPSKTFEIPFGKARILKEGKDITIVGVSHRGRFLRAADLLKEAGISAEIIDPISLSPIDYATIRKSCLKTKKDY